MFVSNQHFDAGFFAGMKTIIAPCMMTIFDEVLGKFDISMRKTKKKVYIVDINRNFLAYSTGQLELIDEKLSVAIICDKLNDADMLSKDLVSKGYPNCCNKAINSYCKIYVYSDQEMANFNFDGIDYILHATLPTNFEKFVKRFARFESAFIRNIQSTMENPNAPIRQITSIILTSLYDKDESILMSTIVAGYFKNKQLPVLYRHCLQVISGSMPFHLVLLVYWAKVQLQPIQDFSSFFPAFLPAHIMPNFCLF